MKNACKRGTPHGAVGQTVSPTASGVPRPEPRNADPRVLTRFWPDLAGFALGNAHRAVGGKYCPAGSWRVLGPRLRGRGANSAKMDVFYRCACPAQCWARGYALAPHELSGMRPKTRAGRGRVPLGATIPTPRATTGPRLYAVNHTPGPSAANRGLPHTVGARPRPKQANVEARAMADTCYTRAQGAGPA